MAHYEVQVFGPMGDHYSYVEADSPEAAVEKLDLDGGRLKVGEVTEREQQFGFTLIMGGHTFGSGPTLEDAKRVFRRYGGKLANGYSVMTFDEETDFIGVDQMGRYTFLGNAPQVKDVPPRGKR